MGQRSIFHPPASFCVFCRFVVSAEVGGWPPSSPSPTAAATLPRGGFLPSLLPPPLSPPPARLPAASAPFSLRRRPWRTLPPPTRRPYRHRAPPRRWAPTPRRCQWRRQRRHGRGRQQQPWRIRTRRTRRPPRPPRHRSWRRRWRRHKRRQRRLQRRHRPARRGRLWPRAPTVGFCCCRPPTAALCGRLLTRRCWNAVRSMGYPACRVAPPSRRMRRRHHRRHRCRRRRLRGRRSGCC